METPRTPDLERYGLTDDLSTSTGSETSDVSHHSDGISTSHDRDAGSNQPSSGALTSPLKKSFRDHFPAAFERAEDGYWDIPPFIFPRGKEDDGTGTWYRAVQNTIVREGVRLDSPRLRIVTMDDSVRVIETGLGDDGRRVRVDIPVDGYMSLLSHRGDTILIEIPWPGY